MFLDCFQLGLGKPDFNTNFFKLSVDRPNTTQACEPGICLNNTFSFIPFSPLCLDITLTLTDQISIYRFDLIFLLEVKHLYKEKQMSVKFIA